MKHSLLSKIKSRQNNNNIDYIKNNKSNLYDISEIYEFYKSKRVDREGILEIQVGICYL